MSADFSPEFQAYGGWIAAAAIQQQDLFNEVVGSGELQADLDARTLTGDRGVLGGVSLLGSFSELDHTWLWGWANPGFGPDAPAVASTLPVREFGEQHGIGEFTADAPDLSGFPQPTQAAITLAITAGSVLGGRGVWSTAINEGRGHVYLHVADEQLPRAAFDPIATPRLLVTAVSVFPSDHRQVVRGYFQYFGLQYDETPDAIRGTAPNGKVIVASFDDHGRLGNVSV
ncbi:DUF6882 domain-containing protein [Kribbella kalugense]|uniref:Uncharacterized protein n=1 Tax=Kribbella kalugense TaxID=2512221 RepID=A0A4R7ZY90_9ACTN|nr:DUF6882 domain-containing protein [Kribbella kalugense]TDW22151.1 hypothetical protein EV650_0985 [Kribbella kalugense]